MTLTKTRIADAVWNKTDIPKSRSAELVDIVFDVIKQTLASGEDVLISRFGKFSTVPTEIYTPLTHQSAL